MSMLAAIWEMLMQTVPTLMVLINVLVRKDTLGVGQSCQGTTD